MKKIYLFVAIMAMTMLAGCAKMDSPEGANGGVMPGESSSVDGDSTARQWESITAGEWNDNKNFGFRGPEEVDYVGGNAKMNEFQAAMGICNLRYIDEYIEDDLL